MHCRVPGLALIALLTIACLVGFSWPAWAQRPERKPCPYRDTASGKLYWNKNLPIYVSLSPTPHHDTVFGLTTPPDAAYGLPIYFDTEGINWIRTRWAVDPVSKQYVQPKQDVLWPVYADGRAPVTQCTLSHSRVQSRGVHLLGSRSTIALQAVDRGAGVEAIYYSFDSLTWLPYGGPFTPDTTGRVTLYFYAYDHVGNTEATHEFPLLIDTLAPLSTATVTGVHLGASNTLSANSVVLLTAHDETSGTKAIFYRLDSGAWATVKPPFRVPLKGLEDGNHALYFYAEDLIGNKEEVQVYRFFLDITAPITISDVLGDRYIVGDKTYFSGRTKMKITAVDNRAGVKEVRYAIDGDKFLPYDEPFYLPARPGWHIVRYYSIDSMENRTESSNELQFYEYRMKVDKIYVDLTGPSIHYDVTGERFARNDTLFLSPKSLVNLSGSDEESGLKRLAYSIDGDLWEKDYVAPFSLEGIASGRHTMELFAYDNVNNRNIKTFSFFLDSDPPSVSYLVSVAPRQLDSVPHAQEAWDSAVGSDTLQAQDPQSAPQEVYPPDASVYLSAQDAMTGVRALYYSLNGTPLKEYRGAISGLARGSNRLKVVAEDQVGNRYEQIWTIQVR